MVMGWSPEKAEKTKKGHCLHPVEVERQHVGGLHVVTEVRIHEDWWPQQKPVG